MCKRRVIQNTSGTWPFTIAEGKNSTLIRLAFSKLNLHFWCISCMTSKSKPSFQLRFLSLNLHGLHPRLPCLPLATTDAESLRTLRHETCHDVHAVSLKNEEWKKNILFFLAIFLVHFQAKRTRLQSVGVLRHDGLAVLHPAELIHQHSDLLRSELKV